MLNYESVSFRDSSVQFRKIYGRSDAPLHSAPMRSVFLNFESNFQSVIVGQILN